MLVRAWLQSNKGLVKLFLLYFKTCNCCNFILSFTFPDKDLLNVVGDRETLGLSKLSIRKCSKWSSLCILSFALQFQFSRKVVQGRIWARSGPPASSENYQLVHRKFGVLHLFTEHYPLYISVLHLKRSSPNIFSFPGLSLTPSLLMAAAVSSWQLRQQKQRPSAGCLISGKNS